MELSIFNLLFFIIISIFIISVYHYFSETIKNNFKENRINNNEKYNEIIEELKNIEKTKINYESMENDLTQYAMDEINK